MRVFVTCALTLLPLYAEARKAQTKPIPPPLTAETVNDPAAAQGNSRAALLRAQILLDRNHFSVGEFNARFTLNTRLALKAYQGAHGLKVTGRPDTPTRALLERDAAPVLMQYVISDADVAGPFFNIPQDIRERATLPVLGYSSPAEALAEKYQASPALLAQLNRGQALQPGSVVWVPDIAGAKPSQAARIVVSVSDRSVIALDKSGNAIARFPASVGSTHDPLPLGNWKIRTIVHKPNFHYNPKLFWDAPETHTRAQLAPGPNSPVGLVWMGVNRPHYGIHGTPEPSTVGATQSHGCVRLTNWDAQKLAAMVLAGSSVVFTQ